MQENLLKTLRFELEDTKVRLDNFVERLPIKDRKPIYNRIKRINRIIQIIDLFGGLSEVKDKV